MAALGCMQCGQGVRPQGARSDVVSVADAADSGAGLCVVGQTYCSEECVSTQTDLAHCGACNRGCTAGPLELGRCVAGVCDRVCVAGYVRQGAGCVLAAPRLIAPISASTVSGSPEFVWERPAGEQRVELRWCLDRAMTRACESTVVEGERYVREAPLPLGRWHWQVRTLGASGQRVVQSAVWPMRVVRGATGLSRATRGSMPDYNGDGLDDLAVGASLPLDLIGGPMGELRVFEGSPSGISSVPSLHFRDPLHNHYIANSVRTAGDLNGDGYVDLVVDWFNEHSTTEFLRVLYGSPTGLTLSRDYLAATGLHGVGGDVNRDGYADVVVAVGDDQLARENPRLVLLLGGPAGVSARGSMTVPMDAEVDRLHLDSDLNGDGYSDLVLRVVFRREGRVVPEVRVYLGGPEGLERTPSHTYRSTSEFAWVYGEAISARGDLDGDGLADVVIGERTYGTEDSVGVGAVFAYLSRLNLGDAQRATSWYGSIPRGGFGQQISTSGDLDGDGFDDLVVFRGVEYLGRSEEPSLQIFHGGTEGPVAVASVTLHGVRARDGEDMRLTTAADFNNDGVSELVAGLGFAQNPARERVGCVRIWHERRGDGALALSAVLWGTVSGARFGGIFAQ